MERVFADTNIVLDLLSKRPDFYEEAQELFTHASNNEITLCISSLTFINTHYLLSKHYKDDEARKLLGKFKVLVEVLGVDDKILELALVSDFKDFEDGVQYHTAMLNDCSIIITRNKKDFKTSKIPVMTAKEYLKNKG